VVACGRASFLRVLVAAATVFSFAAFAYLAWLHLLMVATDVPMEMRDGGTLATTIALVDGRNPYALPSAVTSGNVYGALYPAAMWAVAPLIGPGFTAHRLLAALSLIGAGLTVFHWLRRATVSRTDALLATALVYAGSIYFTGAVVHPDGFGLLLMLGAVEVMRRGDVAPRAYAGGLVLSLLGLLAKLYFVWPAFAAATYVFLCRDMRRGLAYGIAAILTTAATLAVTGWLLPGYTAIVLLANLGAVTYDPAHLLYQLREWDLFDLPFLAAGATALFLSRRAGTLRMARDPGLFPALSGFSLIALVGALGGHVGAHLSYFFQFLSPFLAVTALGLAAPHPAALAAFRLTLPVAILLSAHLFPLDPTRFTQAEAGFAQAAQLIDASHHVLATSEFAGLLALRRRPLTETGHSEYFEGAAAADPPAWLSPFAPPKADRAQAWDDLRNQIRADIQARRYDLVLIGRYPGPLIPLDVLHTHYRQAGTLDIDMPWAQQHWPVRIYRPAPHPVRQ